MCFRGPIRTDQSKLPVVWSSDIGHKTIKFEVRGFEQSGFIFAINGMLHRMLKSMTDKDSDDSFSSDEDEMFEIDDQFGHITLNELTMLKNEQKISDFKTKNFRNRLNEIVKNETIKKIDFSGITCNSYVFNEIFKVLTMLKSPE